MNESNEKLEWLAKVVSQLDYKPEISAFARLDVLSKRPEQIPLMKQAGIIGLNFGIETMSKEAAKAIKKGYNFEQTISTLQSLRKQIPGIWISAGFISGLKGDTRENLSSKIKLLVNKGLIDNILMSVLEIYPIQHKPGEAIVWDEGWLSSIDKEPEKFGYNIDNDGKWFTDYTDEDTQYSWMKEFLTNTVDSTVFVGVDSFGFLSVRSLGIGSQRSVHEDVTNHEGIGYRILNHKLKLYSLKHIRRYITDKKEWIKSLN